MVAAVSWSNDSAAPNMSTLTAPAITAFDSESSAKALWLEWLTHWFTGSAMTIGTAPPVTMPRLTYDDIHFDLGSVRQPLMDRQNAQELRVIHTPIRTRVLHTTANAEELDGRHVFDQLVVTFWLSSRFDSLERSNLMADTTAQALYALLLHPECVDALSLKGIMHLRPSRPQPIQASGIAMRMIRTQAQYHYALAFTG